MHLPDTPAGTLGARVACGRYGGPVAMVRDDRKLVVVTGGLTKPVVRIYTAAGHAMAAFVWDHGRIAAMGWTSEEDLLILEDSGEVCHCILCGTTCAVHCLHLLCTRSACMQHALLPPRQHAPPGAASAMYMQAPARGLPVVYVP